MYMKKLFAVALALLVCVAMTGCAVEKVAPVSGPVARVAEPVVAGPVAPSTDEDDAEPEWNDDEVDAQIPEEYLTGEDDWDDADWGDEDWDSGDSEDADWNDSDWDDSEWDDSDWGDSDWGDSDWTEDDIGGEVLDYGIPRTLALVADGTLVDGNPVDYIISDEMFSSQIDEIRCYSDDYVGKRFAVTGYVMLADDPSEDEHGFAVVRDYQEPHSDDEDSADEGEYMTAEEFAALIESMGGTLVDEGDEGVSVDVAPVATLAPTEAPAPVATAAAVNATLAPEPAVTIAVSDALAQALPTPTETVAAAVAPQSTDAPFAGIEVQSGENISLGDLVSPLPELGAQISMDVDPEVGGEDVADLADDEDTGDDHVHEIYPVGIDCYFEGEIPQADAWVRVVGTLEEYDYYDAEADETFPALHLILQSVTAIPETEGGSRLVTQ